MAALDAAAVVEGVVMMVAIVWVMMVGVGEVTEALGLRS